MHWWWAIASICVVLIVAAYIYSTLTKTTVYNARATKMVQDPSSGSVPSLGDLRLSEALASTYRQLMTARPLLRKVEEELEDGLDLPTGEAGLGKVNVSARSGTPLLDVHVQGKDPVSPVKVANTLIRVFNEDRQTARLAEIFRLEAQAAALRGSSTTDTSALVQAQLSALGNISVIEEASFSTTSVRPSVRKNMVLGGFLGIVLGVFLAFLLEYSSNKIKSVDQIDRVFQSSGLTPSIIGVVFEWTPKQVPEGNLVVQQQPDSIYSEMFRQVRTGFQFATTTQAGKSFLISSVGPQEGKSTVMANLWSGPRSGWQPGDFSGHRPAAAHIAPVRRPGPAPWRLESAFR